MYTKIPISGLSRQEWLQLRKTGIGGSDAAAVCGLNPYSSPMKIFIDKTSDEINDQDNESMRQGRDLEDYVACRFCEETGFKVRRSNYMYRNIEYPFMLADVDRLLVGCDAGLECKTANTYQADEWEGEKIPIHYFLQCQHYLAVTGKKAWYIAVLIMGKEFKYRKIERDEELIKGLIQLEERFWTRSVLNRELPDPDGSENCDKMLAEYYKYSEKNSTILLVGFDEKLKRRKQLDELIERMQTERTEIDQSLKMYLGTNEVAKNDSYKVSWKTIESERLDTKLLKEEHPEIYKAYLKESTYRKFTVRAA